MCSLPDGSGVEFIKTAANKKAHELIDTADAIFVFAVLPSENGIVKVDGICLVSENNKAAFSEMLKDAVDSVLQPKEA